MYKLRRIVKPQTVSAAVAALSETARYSAKDILDFLSVIDELQGQEVSATEHENGDVEFFIGNSVYTISLKQD